MRLRDSIFSRRTFALRLLTPTAILLPNRAEAESLIPFSAPGNPLPLEADEAKALALRYADAQAAKDPDAIIALFFEDGVYNDTQNIRNGVRNGRDQIGEYFRQSYSSYPDLIFAIDAVAVHTSIEPSWDIQAGVMWTFNGVHSVATEIAGPATGHQVFISGYDQLSIGRSEEGAPLIVTADSYYNGKEFVRQDQRS